MDLTLVAKDQFDPCRRASAGRFSPCRQEWNLQLSTEVELQINQSRTVSRFCQNGMGPIDFQEIWGFT